jgi:hypothetical protein
MRTAAAKREATRERERRKEASASSTSQRKGSCVEKRSFVASDNHAGQA